MRFRIAIIIICEIAATMIKVVVSTIVRKAVEIAKVAVRMAELIPPTIVRKAVEVAKVAVRTAVINNRPKFATIKHPRPGTKYRQTRTSSNKK